MARAKPVCPGCGRQAPAPGSPDARTWKLNMSPSSGPVALCPACFGSERQILAEFEHKRQALSRGTPSPDTIVFVRGEALTLADCTADDLEWLADDAKRQEEQAAAWLNWFRQMVAIHENRGSA
jgi:hypothetical protein